MTNERRVLVAMSGGVDSSAAAALLLREGYEVTGLRMRFAAPRDSAAPGELPEERDALAVGARLGIPVRVLDRTAEFEDRVVRRFVAEYAGGRTPSPCLFCNREVKFRILCAEADRLGARWVATGHYARVRREGGGSPAELLRARDPRRDQSYFLALLARDELDRALFPMGERTKDDARAIARELGLPVADKDDSQDLCFVPGDRYLDFVRARASEPDAPGVLVDRAGRVLGTHRGIAGFTIGQRRGLGIAAGRPLYVVEIDAARGRVVVGDERELMADGLVLEDASWLDDPAEVSRRPLVCKIRYKHAGAAAHVVRDAGGAWAVRFEKPQRAVTPGQVAVLYDGERVVGGGFIARAL